jgi:hypothetical protein
MGLLARHRRWWFVVGLCVLAVPMLVQVLQPTATTSENEARTLSPAPAFPRSLEKWRLLPRELDRFLADHFGLRSELVRLHGVLRYAVLLPTDLRVVFGRDEWLFFNGDGMIEQSMGLFMREADIAKFADRAAALQAKLRAQNAEFLVTIPPNSATIMRSLLPAWAATKPAISEYDLMMKALAARGVPAADLRPALLAANAVEPMYRRTDTHWNKLGALVAYNAVVDALHRPDWKIDPARVFRGFEPVAGGDLARMLSVSADVADVEAKIDLSPYAPPQLNTVAIDTQRETGGDMTETGRVAPTERVMFCWAG